MARVVAGGCAVCERHAEAVFHVEGMDCHEEVGLLERRLKPLSGLEAMSADVMSRRLRVQYDAARLTPAQMIEAVGPTGLRMWLEHEPPAPEASTGGGRVVWTALAGVLIGVGFLASWLGQPRVATAAWLIAVGCGGVHPARRALVSLRAFSIDIHVLMLVAVIGALALGEFFEAASVVSLFSVAQWLEAWTLERARHAIGALVDLAPQSATRRNGGVERTVSVAELAVGDTIVVRPGERLPADGLVTDGRSDVNEAPMTGESVPVEKAPGSDVYAGTINGRGSLDVAVRHVGRDTRLARIVHLVEQAQASRAPLQSFVDRFARSYTPAVIALALLVALVPPLVGAGDSTAWLYRGLVLLVVACPCALVISTPVSVVAALSAAARHGVLVKGGVHLERLARVRVVAFDKTGTLTHGSLGVSDVVAWGGHAEHDVVRYAAGAELRSEHAIGRAIVGHARLVHLDPPPPTSFLSTPGLGAEATVDGRRVLVGNERFMASHGVALPDGDRVSSLRREGKSVVLVALDGALAGMLAVADRHRDAAARAVAGLRAEGIEHVVMLTGDHEATARATAAAVGVDAYRASLLPDQKHEAVTTLQAGGRAVLMVGDGVNDAPALAAADVGVAMAGGGTDAALEAADVALTSDDLMKLPYAIRLARRTVRTIHVNVAISLGLKVGFVVMAVAGSATLWMAVLADTGASVIVVMNALRLLRTR